MSGGRTVVKTAVRVPLHAVSSRAKGSAGLGTGLAAGTVLQVLLWCACEHC